MKICKFNRFTKFSNNNSYQWGGATFCLHLCEMHSGVVQRIKERILDERERCLFMSNGVENYEDMDNLK